ncbi:MAG: phosphatase PAP2 family protein [Deltaproteobacteria bacterium]|nr:phosphatase PAP2 family protein [Deltaproteobacteria bacterium]
METRTNRLADQALRILPAVALIVAAGIVFLDEAIALAVETFVRSNPLIGEYTDDMPDLLLPAVLVLSAGMWTAWYLRTRKGLRDARTDFYRLGGTVLPAAFIAKTAFKLLFGRIETRVWLKDPAVQGIQWFHSGDGHSGFPSGHMTVFAALAAACWIFYPRLKGICFSLLLTLGAAMLATNYHFLSDVVAGGYLGLAVAAAAFEYLERHAS